MDLASIPPILGFNETRPAPGAEILLEIRHGTAWYPLLAERKLGAGRVTAFTSGASPHWGVNFMKWPGYGDFWRRVFLSV